MTNLPNRKYLRLPNYDYSSPGAYFITVCTKNKRKILGHLVGCGACDTPRVECSKYGQILEKHITDMGSKYTHIKVDKYIIMPDHFHMLLRITDYTDKGMSQAPYPTNNEVSKFVSLLKRYCNREYGENIWQISYYDHIIRNEKDYLEAIQYIETNPLRLSLGYSRKQ